MGIGRITIVTLATLALLSAAFFFVRSEPAAGAPANAGTPVPMNIPTTGPGSPTPEPKPTSTGPGFITNDSGEVAIFVYEFGSSGLHRTSGPEDCGDPDYYQRSEVNNPPIYGFGWAFIEVLWAAPCVDPQIAQGVGQKVSVRYTDFGRLFGYVFRSAFVTETFVNDGPANAGWLNVVPPIGSIGEPLVVEQPPGCAAPTFDFEPLLGTGDIDIIWPSACIALGDQVILHLAGASPEDTSAYEWSVNAPVGGVAELPDAAPAAPLDVEQSSGASVGRWAAIAAAAGVAAAGGVAWYARRRTRG